MTTQDKALELAHRIAWRYKKSSDPNHSDTWTFNKDTLLQFVAAILQPASGMPPRIVALLEEVIECNWQCPDGLPLADDARKALYCKDSHEASLKYIEGWEACKRAQPASVPSSMIDSLWNSSEVMALNAEIGLTMDQLARLARAILSIAPQPAQAQCTRSHPHENMSAECEALTVKAREANAAARAVPQPASRHAGVLKLGVVVEDSGAHICLMQPHTDGSMTCVYSGAHAVGESCATIQLSADSAAPQPAQAGQAPAPAPKPAADPGTTIDDGARIFARVMEYGGKERRQVVNPCITARECIALANYIAASDRAHYSQGKPQGEEPVGRIMRSAQTLALAVHFKQPKEAQDQARENLRAVVLDAMASAKSNSVGAPQPEAQPTDTAGALIQQIREVCAATLKAGPGVAVPMPDAVRSEMQRFMLGEPSLIERLPFCDVVALSESEEVQALAAPSAQAEPPICGNCDEPAPGCSGLFASDGAVCQFHGKQASLGEPK